MVRSALISYLSTLHSPEQLAGLLETDVHRIVGGNRDLYDFVLTSFRRKLTPSFPSQHSVHLARSEDAVRRPRTGTAQEHLGCAFSFLFFDSTTASAPANNPNLNAFPPAGAALISKFPILRSTHHLLPSPSGELAPAIFATLDVYGVELDVVVAHNGQEEDPVDRQLQSMELGRLMRESWPKPTLFLGASFPLPFKDEADFGCRLPRYYAACGATGSIQVHLRGRQDLRRSGALLFFPFYFSTSLLLAQLSPLAAE